VVVVVVVDEVSVVVAVVSTVWAASGAAVRAHMATTANVFFIS
jgi:hypothetical protein